MKENKLREVKFNKNGKEETAYVKSAAGYNDGYYWDCSATVIFNDMEYSIQDAGSGSGYVPHYESISVNGPCKLVSLMQLCEHEEPSDYDDQEYIDGVISYMMATFFAHNCKESYQCVEGDHFWNLEVYIDGKKEETDDGSAEDNL